MLPACLKEKPCHARVHRKLTVEKKDPPALPGKSQGGSRVRGPDLTAPRRLQEKVQQIPFPTLPKGEKVVRPRPDLRPRAPPGWKPPTWEGPAAFPPCTALAPPSPCPRYRSTAARWRLRTSGCLSGADEGDRWNQSPRVPGTGGQRRQPR